MNCDIHDDPLRVFCITCQKLICRDCTVIPRHRKHDFYLVKDIYPKQKQEIESKLKKLKERVDVTSLAMNTLTDNEREIGKQGEDVKSKIHNHAQYIMELVQQSERQLTEQVDTIVQKKHWLLDKQREEIKSVFDQLKSCEEFVESCLKEYNPQKLLKEKQVMIKQIETINENTDSLALDAMEEANITFIEQHTPVAFPNLGTIVFKYYQDDSKATVGVHNIEVRSKKSTISQKTESQNDSLKTLSLKTTVLPVLVPKLTDSFVKVIPRLKKPSGTAVTESGRIIVAENSFHCITILNQEGEELSSFGTKGTRPGQFTNPRGVAITPDGYILVTDDHRIQKLTFNGQCVKYVGSDEAGYSQGCFYRPTGITVDRESGRIFVADTENHQIQVYENDLNFFSTFGGYGNELKQFQAPFDVALDSKGRLYVSDSCNHCIKMFTTSGQYISKIGSKGSQPGQLNQPTGISVDKQGYIYVIEKGNKRISVFNSNGEFVDLLGKKIDKDNEFCGPQYITVDSIGNIYVSDTDSNNYFYFSVKL